MAQSPVRVATHPETGNVITPNANKPEFGSIRVESVNKSLENGFLNVSKRSGFIHGRIEDLEDMGFTAGKVMTGKIIRIQSLLPFYEGQDPKINPTTQEPVLTNGQLTYFQDLYTEDKDAKDHWKDDSAELSQLAENVQRELDNQQV